MHVELSFGGGAHLQHNNKFPIMYCLLHFKLAELASLVIERLYTTHIRPISDFVLKFL